jgi:hypothetical protein
MKYLISFGVAIALATMAAAAPAAKSGSPPPAKAEQSSQPPGYAAAQTISMITGVAISPLLGVGAVGFSQWYNTPSEKRGRLPWYAQPWFWIPALLVVALVMAKDILGTSAPVVLKKPIDVAEAIENKVSGLIAAGAFVPLVTQFVPSAPGTEAAQWSAMGFAALDLASIVNVLMVPFALAAFGLVWLASHAINMLILISPFATVDAALKAFRAFLLAMVFVTFKTNPYLGALFSVGLIILSYFIAGWYFRLLVMGNVFLWDYLTFRRFRFTPAFNGNWMFTACKIDKTPIRTYGRLFSDEPNQLRFEYRPWLLLPKRTLQLPAGTYAVGRGLFYPEIMRDEDAETTKTLFTLPPRYRTHEVEVAKACRFGEVRDVGILKGFKLLWNWLKGLFGYRNKIQTTPAAA